MNDDLKHFVQARLNVLGINPFEAARRGALERSFINDILIGRKKTIRDDKKSQVADALGVTVAELMGMRKERRRVQIVGFASAGGDEIQFADGQGPFGDVDAPAGANDNTVAVEIRGTSLGRLLDGWLAFYDDRKDHVEESLVGTLCVCGLKNGGVVIKRLRRGSAPGLYHLESATEGTLFDQPVIWAAKVRELRPA